MHKKILKRKNFRGAGIPSYEVSKYIKSYFFVYESQTKYSDKVKSMAKGSFLVRAENAFDAYEKACIVMEGKNAEKFYFTHMSIINE